MNVVDSSAWLEFLSDGTNANLFIEPLSDADNLIVPAITIYEVFRSVYRQKGENYAMQTFALMQKGQLIELDASLSIAAAKISLKYEIPMADSIIYATAVKFDALLWTQDKDFETLPNVKYFTQKK